MPLTDGQPLPLPCTQLYGRIIETKGASEENGVLIADKDEQWQVGRALYGWTWH